MIFSLKKRKINYYANDVIGEVDNVMNEAIYEAGCELKKEIRINNRKLIKESLRKSTRKHK